FSAFHYNDKIRRIQAVVLHNTVPATKPFQFSEGIAEFQSASDFSSGLLFPVVHPRLVEPAVLNGKFVTFRVPPSTSEFAALEPRATMDHGAEVRPAPAYVHARTKVRDGILIDLGNDPANPDVRHIVRDGH